MFGTHDLLLFVISGLLLNLTPGPDTLYIVGRSTSQGTRAGATAALGIGAGTLVHISAGALGLSAILAASATAFNVVKMVGAVYLVYVGIALIRASGRSSARAAPLAIAPAAMRTVFFQGFLTNVLNPKVALFFVAFLPQFIASDSPSMPLAFLYLGLIFNLNGTLWNLFVAWSAARITKGLRRSFAFTKWFDRCVGSLFVCLGVKLALVRGT